MNMPSIIQKLETLAATLERMVKSQDILSPHLLDA